MIARRLVDQLSSTSFIAVYAESALALAGRKSNLASLALIKTPGVQLLNITLVSGTLRVPMRQEVKALVIVEWVVVDTLEAQHAKLVTTVIALLFQCGMLVGATQAAAGNTWRQVDAERCIRLLASLLGHLGFQLQVVRRVPLEHGALEEAQLLVHITANYYAATSGVVLRIQQVLDKEGVSLESILVHGKAQIERVTQLVEE